jgi:hypothetical protein
MCHPDRNRYLRFDGQAVLPNEPIFKIKKTALSDFHKSINDDFPMTNVHNNEPNLEPTALQTVDRTLDSYDKISNTPRLEKIPMIT